jgi:uncharacterized protein (DUF433 family)
MGATALGVSKEHITKTPGVCGGKACIAGTRIRVRDILAQVENGLSPEKLTTYFSTRPLTLSEIYAALSYAYDNQAELADDEERDRAIVREAEARFPSKLQARIDELRREGRLPPHVQAILDAREGS